MKKSLGLFVLVLLALTACSPSSRVAEPGDVGDQVMTIIEDMDDMSKEDFRSVFMTYDEMQDLANNKDAIKENKARKLLKMIDKSQWNDDIDTSFEWIKKNGSRFKIKWSEIQFVDFEYQMDEKLGLKTCSGKVTFKSRGKKYEMNSKSIFDGKGYCLVSLRGPSKLLK